jgi:predicted RNase H-like HicB family nuclease
VPHPIGLYYPFIHFKDEDWLKLVALYWPKLARIVPPGYPTHDSEVVKRLAGELGFVINLDPEPSVSTVGESFAELLDEHAAALQESYGVSKRHEWPPDPVTVAYAPPGQASEPSLAYVYTAKMQPHLVEALTATGLVLPRRGWDESWIGMHPRLADVYMSALADALAEANELDPVTDETLDHLAVGGWDMPHLGQALLGEPLVTAGPVGEDDISKALGMLAIESIVPKEIGQVPIDRIINLRKKYGAEFDAFRTHLNELAAGLASLNVQDPKIMKGYLEEEYNTKLAPQLNDLREGLNKSKVDTTMTAMNVETTLPPLIGSGAALAGITIDPVIALGGAAALAILPMFGAHRTRKKELASGSPVAYMLRVEKGLRPNIVVQWLTEGWHQFLRI